MKDIILKIRNLSKIYKKLINSKKENFRTDI
jgi:hypothetical protein